MMRVLSIDVLVSNLLLLFDFYSNSEGDMQDPGYSSTLGFKSFIPESRGRKYLTIKKNKLDNQEMGTLYVFVVAEGMISRVSESEYVTCILYYMYILLLCAYNRSY